MKTLFNTSRICTICSILMYLGLDIITVVPASESQLQREKFYAIISFAIWLILLVWARERIHSQTTLTV
jgi:hypothetical protein